MDIFWLFIGIIVVIALVRVSSAPNRSRGTRTDANTYWGYSGDGGGHDANVGSDSGGSDGGGFDGGGSDGGGDSSSGF